ncbi:hypothetical protein BXZ70DRAFT_246234 [Cristinia sonorae]|uniref:Fe2OG dioxygenase domain-containing protein n=1 Tax=Cristinia sonorae TaxID=1940300 RepID=A0A8K0UY45_9AGAR|nr:hypothetical protein BXZ70DRAFT_246234 [Cristinia sonorae]
MAKKTKAPAASARPQAPAIAPATTTRVDFPIVSPKNTLECRVLVEDQILLIDEFFSPEECKSFVRFIDTLPLELTVPKNKKYEADRANERISITSTEFANRLWEALQPHLPPLPFPPTARKPAGAVHVPHSLNSNIRLYKYSPGQYFGCHYDDSVKDAMTGAKSEWTLLIYLTGEQDGVKGGETIFYKERRGKPSEKVVAPLTRGTALLHRHGNQCLLHEGSPVLPGASKYVLRSDLMFMN